MGLLISMEEKGENRDTIKGLKVALFGPNRRDWRCDFLVYLVANYGGDLLIVCQSGEPVGTDFVFAVYLLIFSCASAGPTSVIQSA